MSTRKALSTKYLQKTALQLPPENPRIHADELISELAQSQKSFGFNVQTLVDAQLKVIAGNGRVVECQPIEIAAKPVIHLDHLSAHQIRAFAKAHNGLGENAEWDNSFWASGHKNSQRVSSPRPRLKALSRALFQPHAARY